MTFEAGKPQANRRWLLLSNRKINELILGLTSDTAHDSEAQVRRGIRQDFTGHRFRQRMYLLLPVAVLVNQSVERPSPCLSHPRANAGATASTASFL
jgi:hypothetical protein